MVHSVLLASPRGPTALKTHTSEDADVETGPSSKFVQIEGFKEITSFCLFGLFLFFLSLLLLGLWNTWSIPSEMIC